MYLDNEMPPDITDFVKKNVEEIEKIYSISSVSYIFHNGSMFSEGKYKIFKGMITAWFLKNVKILHNGKIKLIYMTSGCKALREMMPYLSEEEICLVMINLLNSIKEIQENGFLDYSSLQLTLDEIFIEQNTLDIKLVYLPLALNCDTKMSEQELRQELLHIINSSPIKSKEKIRSIYNEISNERQTIIATYYAICSLYDYKGNIKAKKENEQKVEKHTFENTKEKCKPILILSSRENNTVFKINKEEYIIGRGEDKVVDGVITFNSAIGRAHCKFVYQEDGYCLVDLESMNYTYLNGARLKPYKLYRVFDGDYVKLANSEFEVQIQRG